MYRRNIKLSQINICGMSNHSQIALNKLINITIPYVLCINETKKGMTSDKIDNYTVVSAINGNNSQGVAMLIHSSLPFLRIHDLENIHFDSIWIVTVLYGKKVVIGTEYNQPSPEKMQHFIDSLGILKSYCISNALDGGIFFGDCNARNVAWGDNIDIIHGTLFEDYIATDFAILNGPEPTFLAKNGSSVIDLILCCGSICDIPHRSSVDKDVELFSGAPNRDHIPVTVGFESVSEAITTKSKPWIGKADWDNWSLFLEQNSYTVPAIKLMNSGYSQSRLLSRPHSILFPQKLYRNIANLSGLPNWKTRVNHCGKQEKISNAVPITRMAKI